MQRLLLLREFNYELWCILTLAQPEMKGYNPKLRATLNPPDTNFFLFFFEGVGHAASAVTARIQL